MFIRTEEQIKEAYALGWITDAEFENLIDSAIRGEQILFWSGQRRPDICFGPSNITDSDIPAS